MVWDIATVLSVLLDSLVGYIARLSPVGITSGMLYSKTCINWSLVEKHFYLQGKTMVCYKSTLPSVVIASGLFYTKTYGCWSSNLSIV